MDVRPLPGTTGERLLVLLRDAQYALETVRGSNHEKFDMCTGYLEWTNNQLRMLSTSVTPRTLDLLVTTPRYWALLTLDPSTLGKSLASLVNLEFTAQIAALVRAQEIVQRDMTTYRDLDLLLVPDTNVYLQAPQRFDMLPWARVTAPERARVRLLVPLFVIDEIDRSKRLTGKVDGSDEPVRTRARVTLRRLEELFNDPSASALLPTGEPEAVEVSIGLLMEEPSHVRLPAADNEIIDQARAIADLSGVATAIVTDDTGMRLRARAAGLTVFEIPQG